MIDFLEKYLLTRYIWLSKSQFTAETWMISKKDPTAMPRIIHDYCALNENTIKDHTSFLCKGFVIGQLTKVKYHRK